MSYVTPRRLGKFLSELKPKFISILESSGNKITYTNGDGTTGELTVQGSISATDTSSKIFLLGASTQEESAETFSDNEIYATDGELRVKQLNVADGCYLKYDSTNKCVNFVFE